MPIPLIPLLAAAAPMIGAGINALSQHSTNNRQLSYSREQYARERADNLKQWHLTNEYNSPRAQMQRLQQAGLNPNLIYGSGGQTGGTASPASTPSAPSYNPKAPDYGDIVSSSLGGLQSYYNIKQANAQLSNLEAQNTLLANQAAATAAETANKTIAGKHSQLELDKALELRKTSMDMQVEQLRQLQLDIAVKQQSADQSRELHPHNVQKLVQEVSNQKHTAAQIQAATRTLQNTSILQDYEIYLNKMGIQKNDPMWARGLAHLASAILEGKSVKQALTEAVNMAKSIKR